MMDYEVLKKEISNGIWPKEVEGEWPILGEEYIVDAVINNRKA